MSPHKRRKLYMKRTPWRKHRLSSRYRAAQTLQRAMVVAHGLAHLNMVRQTVGTPAYAKHAAMAAGVVSTMRAAAAVPLPGASKCQSQ